MGQCVEIKSLTLDATSIDALERIRRKPAFAQLAAAFLSGGIISSIFTKSNAATAAYNITQTDFSLYTQAMLSIPEITRVAIQKDMDLMIVHYQHPSHYDRNLLIFWQNLRNGCQYP